MTVARLNLLGGFEMKAHGRMLEPVPLRKAALLMAYLALHPDRPQRREKLATLLWEDRSEEQARASLRQALSVVRRAVPGSRSMIDARNDCIAFSPGTLTTDVDEFESAVENGSARDLVRAVALYQGDLLEGITVRSLSYETWLHGERHRLRMRAVSAMLKLLQDQHDCRAPDVHATLALRILMLDPAQEIVHQALMRFHFKQGRFSEAIRQYRRCREALARELGVEPDAETENLYQQIMTSRQTALHKRPEWKSPLLSGEA